MKKTILCLTFSICSILLIAQDNNLSPTFEVSLSTFQTNPMVFSRDYDYDFQNGIYSSNTLGYNIAARRTQSIFSENLNWFVGTRVGVHAFRVDFTTTEEFVDLGWDNDLTTYHSGYNLFFADVFTGLRYDFPINERMKFGVELAGVVNYHLRDKTGYGVGALAQNGEDKDLLDVDIIVNDKHKVMFAPQLGFTYQYNFKNSGLRFGAYTLMATNNVLEGTYEIYGDNETLNGTLTKDYNFGGLEIGYFWNLKK